MVTKGIIKSIDLLGNTCTVHIPFFETAGNDPIVETATVSNTPGSYNGYRVGDVVYVAFEDGSMSTPVVIGKLYLGTEKEKADPRGVINVEESTATKKASLPADSTLTADIEETTPNTTVPYSSLASIANGLNNLNTEVGQMDRDYGNRFKQSFSVDGQESTLQQAVDQIMGSVSDSVSNIASTLDQRAGEISAKVTKEVEDREAAIAGVNGAIEGVTGDIADINKNKLDATNTGKTYNDGDGIKKYGFGWDLNDESWAIKAYDQTVDEGLPEEGLNIFKITRDSVIINAPNVTLAGYPRIATVRYAYSDSTTTYPDLYKEDTQSIKDEDINLVATGKNGWTVNQLDWQDGKYIWQWTQTAKYEYSETNNTWVDTITDKVICLAGASAASYYILTNPAQVTYNPNTNKYVPEDKKVAISFYRKVGTGNPELLTDNTFSYSVDAGAPIILSDQDEYNIEVATTTTIKLYNSTGAVIAVATIPVVHEGDDGISIVSQTTYYALINPIYAAGDIAAPNSDSDLAVVATDNNPLANSHTVGPWSLIPPVHNATTMENGWKYWTTVRTEFSEGDPDFSTPIINEEVDGAYKLAQGKTTNYYQNADPAGNADDIANETYGTANSSQGNNIKRGDCWFDTGIRYVPVTATTDRANINGTFSTLDQYIGYYLDDKGETQITRENVDDLSINVNSTVAYKKDQNVLRQWALNDLEDPNSGYNWQDISGELVANKLTANYINALDITAKKVTVIDNKNSGILFEANGLNTNSGGDANYVKIAGFTVEANTLTTGSDKDDQGNPKPNNIIKLNSDGSGNQYNATALTTDEFNNKIEGYTEPDQIPLFVPKVFQRAQSLWTPDNEKHYITYYINNSSLASTTPVGYAMTKVTFTEDIDNFTLYLKSTSSSSNDFVIASVKNSAIIPIWEKDNQNSLKDAQGNSYVEGDTYGLGYAVEVPYGSVSKDDWIYIVYRHESSDSSQDKGGYVHLPTDVRLTIGDNFQVLADGSVYANNLFLGGTVKESNMTPASGSLADSTESDNASGKLAALSAELNHIEVKNAVGETILKADGRDPAQADNVQIGGFNVTSNTLSAGSGSSFIGLQTTEDDRDYTPAEYIEFSGAQYIDTGIIMDYETDAFEITAEATVTDQGGVIFGHWAEITSNKTNVGNTSAAIYHYHAGSGKVYWYSRCPKIDADGVDNIGINSGIATSNRSPHTYKITKADNDQYLQFLVDNTSISSELRIPKKQPDITSTIGAAYYKTSMGLFYHGKIYGCKIWRHGSLIRNFIPVFKGGNYGLYDTCLGQFYENKGTGKLGGVTDNTVSDGIQLNGVNYTRLDYIQNDGTNYIETGISNLNYDTGFSVEVEYMPLSDTVSNTSGADSRCCLLSNHGETTPDISLELKNNEARFYSSKDLISVAGVRVGQKNKSTFTFRSGKALNTLNDSTSEVQVSGCTGNIPSSLRIFVDRINRFETFSVSWRLYSMKIYSGNTKVAHYLPAKNSDGVPGLVNLVSGGFLAQAVGSNFTYENYEAKTGRLITNRADSYRTLQYIESEPNSVSNSSRAYLDTRVRAHSGIAIEVDVMPLEKYSYYGNLGGYNATIGGSGANNGKSYFYCGAQISTPIGVSSESVIGVREVVKQDDKKCYRNGVVVGEFENSISGTCNYSMVLFARRGYDAENGREKESIEDGGKIRIYSCKIWENGSLIRDFIPVIKNETEYGMYDLVGRTFYGNANPTGSGSFSGKSYTAEFTALYLGGTDPEIAPFSVTNTGKLKAEAGEIGGFELTDTGIKSTNGNLELQSSGNIIAKSGDIGGFEITDTGIRSRDNDNLQLNSDGSIIAKVGEIGGFTLATNGFVKPNHLSITSESAFFEAANFSLNNDVVIYNDNTTLVDNAYTSYIATTGTRHFEIKNEGGAGIRFNASPKEETVTQTITISDIVIANGGYVDLGPNADTSMIHQSSVSFKYSLSNSSTLLTPRVITFYLTITEQQTNLIGQWKDKKTFVSSAITFTVPAGSNTGSGNTNLAILTTGTRYIFKGVSKSEETSSASSVTYAVDNIKVSNNILFSLGSFCPITDATASSGCLLGDDSHVWRTVRAYTASITTSDVREKNNIKPLETRHEDFFDRLAPATFIYEHADSGRTHLGFIAQDVEKALLTAGFSTSEFAGLCIGNDVNKTYGLRYEEFIALNTDQIQKLKKRVADQEVRITELEEAIKKLKTE